MAKGKKTGGRKKGTSNKDKQQLMEMIQAAVGDEDYHPVVEMARQAVALRDMETAPDLSVADIERLKLAANKEVANYVAPKLKSVDLTGSGEDGVIQLALMRFTGAD